MGEDLSVVACLTPPRLAPHWPLPAARRPSMPAVQSRSAAPHVKSALTNLHLGVLGASELKRLEPDSRSRRVRPDNMPWGGRDAEFRDLLVDRH